MAPPFNHVSLLGRQYPQLVVWTPVAMGIGISGYFALEQEPDPLWCLTILAPAAILATGLARRLGLTGVVAAWGMLAIVAGFTLALWSAHRVAAPVILFPTGETVEGRVIEVSRSASGRPRLLLDDVMVYGIEPVRMPKRVRLTLLEPGEGLPVPGHRIRVYATLMPAGEPVEPGGFDFQRRAFFAGLGAVGLSRGVVVRVPEQVSASPLARARIWIAGLRDQISRALRRVLPGEQGAFAAAILVGDRAWIDEADQEALRASNLAHLLAISGLHMGILTGLVFGVVRIGLALVPGIALRWPTKKMAAVAALAAGASYLMLSGATVATQRAFVMVAVALVAVLMDRPAITLRALAIAAVIILAIRPISLLDAGFQMSFAATAALVAGFSAVRGRVPSPAWVDQNPVVKAIVLYVVALSFASILAGIATAPFAAYHFNRTAPYGLIANLLAVPLMGMCIAPMACLAAVLSAIGQAELALRGMGWGIGQILDIAHWVASFPGAVQPVRAAPPLALMLVALGGIWLLLWLGRGRLLGLGAVLTGIVVWTTPPPRPELLVAPQARLLGMMTPHGRAIDHPTAQGFAAKTWLRRDGDFSSQEQAATRAAFTRGPGWTSAELGKGWSLLVGWGEIPDKARLGKVCTPKTIVISRSDEAPSGPCLYVGGKALDRRGSIALTMTPDGPEISYSRPPGRKRLWTRR